MKKPKATYDDVYDALSYRIWKTGLEIIKELDEKGKRVGHLRGAIYVHLSEWEDEGFVKSRKRNEPPIPGINIQRTEYARASTGKPKELREGVFSEGLLGKLSPA